MEMMTVIGNLITIVVPILGFMWFGYNRLDKKIEKLNNKLDIETKQIYLILNSIDQRISRLEGAFTERGMWEGRIYAMQLKEDGKKQ